MLPARRRGRVPSLPADIRWSEATRAAWAAWWRSPAATQWLKADLPSLYLMALAYEKASTTGSTKAQAEYRQWADRFGLSPQGRLRNRWIVEEDDQQDERGAGVVRLHPEPDDAA